MDFSSNSVIKERERKFINKILKIYLSAFCIFYYRHIYIFFAISAKNIDLFTMYLVIDKCIIFYPEKKRGKIDRSFCHRGSKNY